MVTGSTVRRTGDRQRPADVLPAGDAEPPAAADHRGHRELVEETDSSQAGHSAARDVAGPRQRASRWQFGTRQRYLACHLGEPHVRDRSKAGCLGL